jgi:transposase
MPAALRDQVAGPEVHLIERCRRRRRLRLARLRDYRCHASAETIEKALTGSYRAEHLFALEQALALYDAYHEKVSACDARIEAVLKELSISRGRRSDSVLSPRRPRTVQVNGLAFDVRAALFALLGKDLTQIDGLGPYLSLKLVAECGDDLSAWASAKHFTSWLVSLIDCYVVQLSQVFMLRVFPFGTNY